MHGCIMYSRYFSMIFFVLLLQLLFFQSTSSKELNSIVTKQINHVYDHRKEGDVIKYKDFHSSVAEGASIR